MTDRYDWNEHPVTISLDIDGTLYDYEKYCFCEWGPLKKGALEFLKEQVERGREIILFTARADIERRALLQRLEQDGILDYVSHIQFGKVTADVYIDDRNIPFRENWEEMSTLVDSFLIQKRFNLGFEPGGE
jgi:predicted phosphatase